MKRRTRKQWYAFHLARVQDAAKAAVTASFSQSVEQAQTVADETRDLFLRAHRDESWVSQFVSCFGVTTRYQKEVLHPLRARWDAAKRVLEDVLERQKLALDDASRRAHESFLDARRIRKEEAEARAARVLERDQRRRIRYLEQSPRIRSAARYLKLYLISQHLKNGKPILCFYCAKVLIATECHLEHKQPVCRGGDNKGTNIVLACPQCNYRKGRKTHKEFLSSFGT